MTYTKEEIDAAYTACVMAIPNERFMREAGEAMFACMTMREATATLKIWTAHPERAQQLKAQLRPEHEEPLIEHLRRVTLLLKNVGVA